MNCKGKYIALFEGDDYWCNPYKLRKQVDFMENNPDYSECFGLAKVIDENDEETDIWPCRIYDAENYMELSASFFIPTSSVIIKNFFLNAIIQSILLMTDTSLTEFSTH